MIFNLLLLFQIASRRFFDVHTHNYFFSTYTQTCWVSKLMQSLWYFQHTIHSTQVEASLPSSLHIFILKDSFGDDFYPLPSCALLTKRYFLRHGCKFSYLITFKWHHPHPMHPHHITNFLEGTCIQAEITMLSSKSYKKNTQASKSWCLKTL